MTSRTMPPGSVDAIDAIANIQFTNSKNGQFEQSSNSNEKVIIFSENNLPETQNFQNEKKSNLKVFITKDYDLLNQYYALRHSSYREENGWKNYDGSENEFDRNGKIVVAVKNGKVIGGMRVMFSDENEFLSNEIPGTEFNYKNLIKKYDKRENLILSEISALVVEKNSRDSTITTMMMECLFRESKSHGCHYIFGVAIALVCRNDRKTIKRLGYDVEIVMNFPWKQKETYNFVRMFPMYTKIQ